MYEKWHFHINSLTSSYFLSVLETLKEFRLHLFIVLGFLFPTESALGRDNVSCCGNGRLNMMLLT